jgi:hypothetical protein
VPPGQLEARQIGSEIRVALAASLRTPAGEPLRPPVRVELLLMPVPRDGGESSWLGGRREREFLRKAVVVLEQPVDETQLGEERLRAELSVPAEALRGLNLTESALVISARMADGKKRRSAPTRRIALLPAAPPAPPAALRAEPEETGVRLVWEPPEGETPAAYHLYRRREGASWSRRPLRVLETSERSFLDESAVYGTVYHYGLRAAVTRGTPYVESESILAGPVDYLDTFPPAVPEEVRVLETPAGLRVVWFWGPGSPASRYLVERAPPEGPFREVAAVDHPGSDWTDESVEEGGRYRYRVIAEDDRGNRSAPSEEVSGRRLTGGGE